MDTERAQAEHFQFYHTLNRCVICFDTVPKESLGRIIHIRDKAVRWHKL